MVARDEQDLMPCLLERPQDVLGRYFMEGEIAAEDDNVSLFFCRLLSQALG